MSVLFIVVMITVCCGVGLLGWMFHRDDSRLGMAGLAVLITANLLAMVHAALDAS